MRRQFYVLKSSLEQAVRDAEAGEFELFDPQAYEPNRKHETEADASVAERIALKGKDRPTAES